MKTWLTGLTFLAVLTGLGLTAGALDRQTQDLVEAPRFEVDPMWPKPLPNGWVLGETIGVGIDAKDHVWIVHRVAAVDPATEGAAGQTPPTGSCCKAAPPVLEFDTDGTLLHSWGGPGQGYEWPVSNHGIFIDYKGIVWIGGNGAPSAQTGGPGDGQILKFTQDGKFVAQFGHAVPNQVIASNDTTHFGRVAKIFVDPKANEAYIADGYLNKRVAVLDADTGAFKRYWGAYGNKPDDTNLGPYDPTAPHAQQFRNPVHCSDLSVDRLLYVCDRQNDRLQVFTSDGTFVTETYIATKTLGDGSIWDVAFSRDPEQKYLYIADGKNERVYVLLRKTLEMLTNFGDGGRQPGEWFAVHSIATDSKGNLYTTETYQGRRLQKFVYKGIGKVPRTQGVVWPGK